MGELEEITRNIDEFYERICFIFIMLRFIKKKF